MNKFLKPISYTFLITVILFTLVNLFALPFIYIFIGYLMIILSVLIYIAINLKKWKIYNLSLYFLHTNFTLISFSVNISVF